LQRAVVESVHVALNPFRLVLRKQRRPVELRCAAAHNQFIVANNDADILKNVFQRQADAREGRAVPVLSHRLGQRARPLDAHFARSIDNAAPKPLNSSIPVHARQFFLRKHFVIPRRDRIPAA